MFWYVGPAAFSVVTVITLIGSPVGAADASVVSGSAAASVVSVTSATSLSPHAAANNPNAIISANAFRKDRYRARFVLGLVIFRKPSVKLHAQRHG
jgi:hypothetical protein